MIPKTIHYCWFGKGKKPKNFNKFYSSWKAMCPDYDIVEWNESNFDVESTPYTSEAYRAKKYAFVSDYVRLHVLYTHGGIYVDTDVEFLSNIDGFLGHSAFSGFQSKNEIPTGIIGAEKGNGLILELLNDYTDRHFVIEGKPDLTTNVTTITRHMLKKGLKLNNEFQLVSGFALYPSGVFCPYDYELGKIRLTEEAVTIHHFSGSWLPLVERIKVRIRRLIGEKNYKNVKKHFKRR